MYLYKTIVPRLDYSEDQKVHVVGTPSRDMRETVFIRHLRIKTQEQLEVVSK
jgi:hypothetical protein